MPTRSTASVEAHEAALASLLGRDARAVFEGHLAQDNGLTPLAQAPEIPVGLPADLLQRRPDVRQAEAELRVANENVAIARSRYFPSLSLTGFYGGESSALANLLDAPARTWNLAGALVQPLVGLATANRQVEQAQSRREASLLTYQQTARNAYADVRSALAAHQAARERWLAAQTAELAQSRITALTQTRVRVGAANPIEGFNAEFDRLSSARQRLQAELARLSALVDVYQALGGGWTESAAAAPETSATAR
jgi:multidrug efflux system outer membrane protein